MIRDCIYLLIFPVCSLWFIYKTTSQGQRKYFEELKIAFARLNDHEPDWLRPGNCTAKDYLIKDEILRYDLVFHKLFIRYSFCYIRYSKKYESLPNDEVLTRILKLCRVEKIRDDALELLLRYNHMYLKAQDEQKKFQPAI